MKVLASTLAIVVIVVNIFFVSETLIESVSGNTHWLVFLAVFAGASIYALFVAYLTVYLLIALGFEGLVRFGWVQKCYNVQEYVDELANAKHF